MGKQLIIVESPAKVKTIKKFLGPQYMVHASVGHVRDLPSRSLGVDEANGFMPQYEVIDAKKKVVSELRAAASKAETVFLAPDPDREGEAIAWHVAELIKDKARDIKRIQFNEITARAVKEALDHPRDLNGHLFDAQQARRVLDRLVGYKISPLLWKTVKRGISAGRVQSVALRLVVEREEEREAFVPEEYWPVRALLAPQDGGGTSGAGPEKADGDADGTDARSFRAELAKVGGRKAAIGDAEAAAALEASVAGRPFVVESVEEKERERAPQPPFITSTLQQAANQRLSYTARRTMNIAQRLYEGVELNGSTVALITYMRTDSTRIADEARKAAHDHIEANYGREFLPARARVYKTRAGAQDAHEAIRPVDVNITPDMVRPHLPPDQHNLYRLIWSRFVASQMAGARFHDTVVQIVCGDTLWRARGERLLFPGFLVVLPRGKDEEVEALPPLRAGRTLDLEALEKERKFTQPPARYSEAALVRDLEERGIGRPSTYASIISTLQDREYVALTERRLVPTDLGRVVCRQLVQHFQRLMDVGFTAQMEEDLDKVAEGREEWGDLMRRFADDFNPTLAAATQNMRSVKGGVETELTCPDCGRPLVIKFGKAGQFLACSGYPDCRHTSDFVRDADGSIAPKEPERRVLEVVGVCPRCGRNLVIKTSRTGSRFIACTGYPDCDHAEPFSTGVACPACGQGRLVEKSSRRGKLFYSCDRYPQCDFAMWDKPVPEACPRCGSPHLVEKRSRSGAAVVRCPAKDCDFVKGEDNA